MSNKESIYDSYGYDCEDYDRDVYHRDRFSPGDYSMKVYEALIFGAVAITGLTLVGRIDYEQEQVNNMYYCHMVQHFVESDLPKIDRPGWPPYRDDIDCADYGFSFASTFSK